MDITQENKRIIYYDQTEDCVCVIVPAVKSDFTLEQIAQKDVPFGCRYKIVDASDIPTDRSFRDSWVVDQEDLTDGVGGPDE